MKPNKTIASIAIGAIIIPLVAIVVSPKTLAEVRVRTANVEAITRNDGSVYVNTGETTLKVPSRRSYRNWNPLRYWNPWRSNNFARCRNGSYQSTKQTTRSGDRTLHNSVSHRVCN